MFYTTAQYTACAMVCQICVWPSNHIFATCAVGVLGRQSRPRKYCFSRMQGGLAALHTRSKGFLEGLKPSKPPLHTAA